MVNPDAIPDGRYVNLYCPECQAQPNDLETHSGREGWRTLRCAYCLSSVNSAIASTTCPPATPFDDQLFQTDD